MLCYRRRKTSKSLTENQRTILFNNGMYYKPILHPEYKDGPSTSPVGPQHANGGNIYEEIPLPRTKLPPIKKSVPPGYERITVRYQNPKQPTKVGEEETDV